MMRPKLPKRVANRIVLLVLGLELLSIVIWGSFTYSVSKQELLNTIGNQLSEIAYRTTTEIGNFFLPLTVETNVLASTIGTDVLSNIDHLYSVLLNRLFLVRPELEEISLVTSNSKEIKRISRMEAIGDTDLRQFENNVIVNNAIIGVKGFGSIEFSKYLEPTIRIATPVNTSSKTNDIRAILVNVNLKWLWETVQSLKVGNTGYVYVIDESLKLIAHPDPSLVLRGIYIPQTSIPDAMFIDQGRHELLLYDSFTGKKVAGVSRFDPSNHWWVIVEQPVREGLAPLDRVIRRFMLAFILAASMTVFIVIFFSKITMKPLVELERGFESLASGKRNVRVNVPNNTEMATLANAFNIMALNLDTQTSRLEYQALHDALTGLPNRQHLFNKLEGLLLDHNPSTQTFALLLLDLDRFKEVNDSLGHKYGDILLKQLRPRLLEALGEGDLLARLGGDEFAVLVVSLQSIDDIIEFVQRLRLIIQEPYEIEGIRIQIDVSIGIAQYPVHGNDGSTLLRHSDIAMYQAKRHNKGWEIYDQEQDLNSPERLALMSGMRRAIDEDELELSYQPKIDLRTNNISCMEALIRWRHPQLGLLSPDQFIPISELGKLINPLTAWVLEHAIQDCKYWHKIGTKVKVAINVSALNIQNIEFVSKVKSILEKHQFDPNYLQLEITESAIMSDTVRAQKTIKALNEMGVLVAVDDFGTGYSSLAYLKKLAVGELKIDKSFVIDMHNDDNDAVIVRSTIDLAHNLGLEVTAEGIESSEVLDLLRILQCDYAQGFHICAPLSANKINEWLKAQANKSHQMISAS